MARYLISRLLAWFFLALATSGYSSAAGDVTVTGARFGGTEDRTRFVADVSRVFNFTAVTLANPHRVIIELGDARFKLSDNAGKNVRGLVKKFTYGIVSNGQSRFILETDGAVRIDKSFMINPKGKQPARIVLDLVRDENAIQQVAAPVEPEQPAQNPISSKLTRKATVVIDAGHGGADPGAVNARKVLEKDIVLSFAKVFRDALKQDPGINVIMTRDSDVFLPLRERVEIAQKHDADLFIAIHADIVRGRTARGTTLYTLSETASDAEAAELARKENMSDLVAGVDLPSENEAVSDVLIELLQRESKHLSMVFAKKSAERLSGVTMLTGKPIRSAGFVVLKAPDVPSVLVELGFLSSREDEKLLISPEWQSKTAKALAEAVQLYLAEAGAEEAASATGALNSAPATP
jgi:N-acetylmuramoyl-L-alanine amidase